MSQSNRLPDAFSKNRAEESKEDNWSDFVVPQFINDLEIKPQSKAYVIIGGRGCGKTTLLKYFCHATQFSPHRTVLSSDALTHIGLYWRADTNFLNSFTGGEQEPEVWRAAFEHLLACDLGRELIRSLKSLNCNPQRQSEYGLLDKIDLSSLQDFGLDLEIGHSIYELENLLQRKRTQLAMWVNNLDTQSRPTFLPAEHFLKTLVETLKSQLSYLKGSTFAIFIDEFENLREEQQQIINGLLKHGSPPLLYNIAMKRNGWHTMKTLGSESLQEISDYRAIFLEDYLSDKFDIFAAELIFFRLAEYRPELQSIIPIIPSDLRSIENIEQRYKNSEYRDKIISAAERILPRANERVAAQEIFADIRLKNSLISRIDNALKTRGSSLLPEVFIDESLPEASVIMPALINRPRENIEDLLLELGELKEGKTNRLSNNKDLIGNNLFGCVNSIYLDAKRNSILFSGFTSLILISQGNLRHLLELIHRIFKQYDIADESELPVVSVESQVTAIRDASESILNTINGSGVYGQQLYSLTTCLGSIFKERHKSDRQSEPELNQFTLSSGEITPQLKTYLNEAEKWSILHVSKETKMKSTGAINRDYTLNPIFSPYFQISFRKKRSLQISTSQLLKMLDADQQTRDSLTRELGRQRTMIGHGDLFEEPEE